MKHSPKRTLSLVQPNRKAIPPPLRYYDPELQDALNVEPFDEDRLQRARAKAVRLNSAYLEEISGLAPRLSRRTFSKFSDPRQPLFDSDLLEFAFGDSLGYPVTTKGRQRTLMMAVRAAFRSFNEKLIHVLTYSDVDSLSVNVPAETWYARCGKKRIDCLLADELTSVDSGLMSHAFLFVSGASVSITFERVRWETKRDSSQ